MTTKYSFQRDINGYALGYAQKPSDTCYSATLTASTDTTLTIPGSDGMGGNGIYATSTWVVEISTSGTSLWVANNATAASPAGATFASTTSQIVPADGLYLVVSGGDVLHFYTTASNVQVSVALYVVS